MVLNNILVSLFLLLNTCVSDSSISEKAIHETDTGVTLLSFPMNNQLYARNDRDLAQITIAGHIEGELDSIITKVYRGNGIVTRTAIKAKDNFSMNIEIKALLYNYTIELFGKTAGGVEALIKKATQVTAGDVYIIHGQSNAWAIDYDNKYDKQDLPDSAQWVRTIGAMHVYNNTAIQPEAGNTDWFVASGKAPDIRNGGPKVGLGMIGVLGMRLGINLVKSQNVPIAIINGAGGGGAISFYQKTFDRDLDVVYGRLQNRIEASGLKDNIKAFIWNQGENNAGNTVESYKGALEELYSSLISDYTFEKFYLVQTPPGCKAFTGHETVREAQRQFSEENEKVHVLTRHGFLSNPGQFNGNYFLSDGCHYHAHGYEVLADWIYNLSKYHFYEGIIDYEAPKVISVQMESSSSIIIEFDKQVAIQSDLMFNGISYTAKDYLFAINKERTTSISRMEVLNESKEIRLTFLEQNIVKGDMITYILEDNYPDTNIPYLGPWIIDAATGVGAVGFTKIIE